MRTRVVVLKTPVLTDKLPLNQILYKFDQLNSYPVVTRNHFKKRLLLDALLLK